MEELTRKKLLDKFQITAMYQKSCGELSNQIAQDIYDGLAVTF